LPQGVLTLTILDANKLADGSEIAADICIVGAGAAGITLARALEPSGAKICLLESGGLKIEEEVQALYDVDNTGYPIRENFMSRVRYFGGSCNLWAGRSMRMSPIDFEVRDWVPNSGWPIDYAQIDPWYERAEQLLQLPRHKNFADVGQLAGIGDQEKALLSSADSAPAIATWASKPMRFGKTFKRNLQRSKNIDVYLNANVTEIVAAENAAAVTRLLVKTMGQRQMAVKARFFVLAAGGLENARLLLASTARHESGVGNELDQVGRYFLDHPRSIYGRVRVNESVRLPYLTGIPLTTGKIQFGIAASDEYQRENRLLNCYASLEPELSEFAQTQYGRSINVIKVLSRRGHAGSRFRLSDVDTSNVRDLIYYLTPKEIMPQFLYKPYALLKQAVRKRRSIQSLSVINYCEQVPDPESRVTLGTDTDALGMRKLRLHWRVGEEVRQSVARLHDVLAKLVQVHGVGELHSDAAELRDVRFSDASHHIGTTRMSNTPDSGVVDSNCRVHGVDNLYVCGSSVFPTGGYANPTLTIVALTLRLGELLTEELSNS
jgi:choline dehydrogenase-like flavoprotein